MALGIGSALVCVAVARGRYRRLAGYYRPVLEASGDDWLAQLDPGSTLAGAIRSVVEAPTANHGVAELNELLAEIQHELDRGRGVAVATARVALFGGWLAAAAELVGTVDLRAGLAAGTAVVAGVVGALVCSLFGHWAEGEAKELRRHWNRVARRLERRFDEQLNGGNDHSVDRVPERR